MNPNGPDWPKPETANLDPKGDFFFGRRLPEYEFTLITKEGEHPIRIVGRYAYCSVHANRITSAMDVFGSGMPCRVFSEGYHSQFVPAPKGTTSMFGEITWSQVLGTGNLSSKQIRYVTDVSQIMDATMADQIRLTYRSAPQILHDIINGDSLGVPSRRYWFSSPEKYVDAREHGCSHPTWIALVETGVPQLARPGFIDDKGNPTILLEAIFSAQPRGALSTIIPMWDKAATEVNVYGTALRIARARMGYDRNNIVMNMDWEKSLTNYFGHMPISDDPDTLGNYIAMATILAPEIEPWKRNSATWTKNFEAHRDYLRIGIPSDLIADYVAANITSTEAAKWMRQGVVGAEDVMDANDILMRRHGISPAQAAWLDYWLKLPEPIGADPDHLRPLPALGNETEPESDFDQTLAVVPEDWWRVAPIHVNGVDSVAGEDSSGISLSL